MNKKIMILAIAMVVIALHSAQAGYFFKEVKSGTETGTVYLNTKNATVEVIASSNVGGIGGGDATAVTYKKSGSTTATAGTVYASHFGIEAGGKAMTLDRETYNLTGSWSLWKVDYTLVSLATGIIWLDILFW